MTQIVFPTMTDDSGSLTDGSIVDNAFFTTIKTNADAIVHSTTNPTVTPSAIIDEVVTARGSKASLDARLDVEHNDDGTHNLSATIVTTNVLANSIQAQNLAANPDFAMWPDGDTTAPVYYATTGSPTIARTGAGLSNTNRKIGEWGCLVTYNAATATFYQTIVDAGLWPTYDHYEGETISFSVWVLTSTVNQVRAYIDDGAAQTYSSYHTADGTWQRLEVTRVINASATKLDVGVQIGGTGNFVVSGFCPIWGQTAPDKFIPPPVSRGAIVWSLVGTPSIGDGQRFYIPSRALIVTDVQIYAKTAPSGGSFTIDVEIGDGTTWNTIFATTLSVLAGKEFAWKEADSATFSRVFMKPAFLNNADDGAAGADKAVMRLNIDAVNSAADITVMVRGWQYNRPTEHAYDYND